MSLTLSDWEKTGFNLGRFVVETGWWRASSWSLCGQPLGWCFNGFCIESESQEDKQQQLSDSLSPGHSLTTRCTFTSIRDPASIRRAHVCAVRQPASLFTCCIWTHYEVTGASCRICCPDVSCYKRLRAPITNQAGSIKPCHFPAGHRPQVSSSCLLNNNSGDEWVADNRVLMQDVTPRGWKIIYTQE